MTQSNYFAILFIGGFKGIYEPGDTKTGGNNMKKLQGLLIIFFVFFITAVNAQDAPEEYTVKKGDTLWDITEAKFQDAFLWPNLWRVNPQIKNPDLIFPGDIIKIPSKEELLRLPAMAEKKPSVSIPAAVEKKPLAEKPKKYIIEKNRYFSSGWIDDYAPLGKIMSAPGNRTNFGKYDLVYLKSITDQKISVGDRFFAVRNIKKVNHPKTGKYLGQQIRITGTLEVKGMDGKDFEVPRAQITNSFENLQVGDGIIPYTEMEPPVVPDNPRTPVLDGYIAESYMNTGIISKGDIIYLDRGESDGVEIGDVFSTLTEDPVLRSIGKIQVFLVKPATSTAIILLSDQEITVGDMWGNR